MKNSIETIKNKFDEKNFEKIKNINNQYLNDFIVKYIELLNPKSIFVCNDSEEDFNYIRNKAIMNGEEIKLNKANRTLHFDGIYDQARDKKRTKFLLPKGVNFGDGLNTIDKEEGLADINDIMSEIMNDRELLILFFTLGPANSSAF